MKIQIEVNAQLWADFKAKVYDNGKMLREVVPGVIEPALRDYIEPPKDCPPPTLQDNPLKEEVRESYRVLAKEVLSDLPIIDRPADFIQRQAPDLSIRRCDSCDEQVERLFSLEGKRVCYKCWKSAITSIPVPAPPTPPEAA